MAGQSESRNLLVFLCHASEDKPTVRRIRDYVRDIGADPWLDEEKLLPGQEWEFEIRRAAKASDAIVVCLSKKAVPKEGFIQREIRLALSAAEEKPEEQSICYH